jgi:hypothetical protein
MVVFDVPDTACRFCMFISRDFSFIAGKWTATEMHIAGGYTNG